MHESFSFLHKCVICKQFYLFFYQQVLLLVLFIVAQTSLVLVVTAFLDCIQVFFL